PAPTDWSQFVGMRLEIMPRLLGLTVALELERGRPDTALRTVREFRIKALRSLRQGSALSTMNVEQRAKWEEARTRYETLKQEHADAVDANWSLSTEDLALALVSQSKQQEKVDAALADALQILNPMSAMDLRPPGPDETMVAWVPSSDRWVGLIADASGVRSVDGPETTAQGTELAHGLVASLQGHIGDTGQLTFLPFGAVHDLELHSAPWGEARLIDAFDLAWSLDMPTEDATTRGNEIWVIGDPDSTLPGARAEAEALAKTTKTTLLLGEAANRDMTLAALSRASMLHYAGHGTLDPEEAFRSGLTLADSTLDVADVLSLSSAPSFVVLSGCETGRSRGDRRVATLGIAQAFLLSGSHVVVASSSPVADQHTTALLAGLLKPDTTPYQMVHALNERQRASLHPEKSLRWKAWIR
ncbi:MAG: CHAT domain-containing protein, partial [Myxococcota bacterium]